MDDTKHDAILVTPIFRPAKLVINYLTYLKKIFLIVSSTMTQVRLSNLALIYIERDMSSKLWDKIDELVVEFAQTHNNLIIVLF